MSVACMIGIALLLIPHPACAIWVTLAIGSIDLGIIGYMTLWGLNMDTISMVTIIMSIGFSVDFTAHIAYAYVANIHEQPDDRIRNALGTLAWPVLQGGISTLIGVIVLADLNSYMVVSFFKTVFLVIVFGLMHALIFLPVLLSLSTEPMIVNLFRRKKASSSSSVTEVANSAENDKKKMPESSSTGPLKRLLRCIRFRFCKKKGHGKKSTEIETTGEPVQNGRRRSVSEHTFRTIESDTNNKPTSPSPAPSSGSLQRRRSCSAVVIDDGRRSKDQDNGLRSSLSDSQCDKNS